MKLPPVLVFLSPVLAGWAVAGLVPATHFQFRGQSLLAVSLLISGAAVLFMAVAGFQMKRTTVDPIHPDRASVLVEDGIYRISRNPMYLGMALVAASVSLYHGHGAGLIALAFAIAYTNERQIKPEEGALTERFGAVYLDYCKRVRRWI